MDRASKVLFPVSVSGREVRAVVPHAADVPEDAEVALCADGTVCVAEAEEHVRISAVCLTAEQVQRVLEAHNALQAATLPPR